MNRTIRCVCVVIVAMAAEPAFGQTEVPQRLENGTFGISLVRPSGWQSQSLQAVLENRQRVQLSDAELQEAMRKAATAPLFAFTRHPEPFPGINPSIQVTLRPVGPFAGASPTAILKAAVSGLQKGFVDFVVETAISDIQVSGLAAAHMRAKYTLRTDNGSEFKVLARLWVVPRGAFMFVIGMSGPQEGPDVSEAEFANTLASIRIQK